ncbi:hypothetical protein BESB_002770 [Besnoitia besnoiti]|uniref:mRNA export factor GLE1 n=1 Tax=Besnoitia besnoiti TaxID=94643 RepID=A0A2A9MNT9_BESBE|nr:hypothetical protein BESB_002770 [Besnoitia besnoiti]PFH37936.1 hypothetical protein BESB_002770 [Besnoitia besnoiti]
MFWNPSFFGGSLELFQAPTLDALRGRRKQVRPGRLKKGCSGLRPEASLSVSFRSSSPPSHPKREACANASSTPSAVPSADVPTQLRGLTKQLRVFRFDPSLFDSPRLLPSSSFYECISASGCLSPLADGLDLAEASSTPSTSRWRLVVPTAQPGGGGDAGRAESERAFAAACVFDGAASRETLLRSLSAAAHASRLEVFALAKEQGKRRHPREEAPRDDGRDAVARSADAGKENAGQSCGRADAGGRLSAGKQNGKLGSRGGEKSSGTRKASKRHEEYARQREALEAARQAEDEAFVQKLKAEEEERKRIEAEKERRRREEEAALAKAERKALEEAERARKAEEERRRREEEEARKKQEAERQQREEEERRRKEEEERKKQEEAERKKKEEEKQREDERRVAEERQKQEAAVAQSAPQAGETKNENEGDNPLDAFLPHPSDPSGAGTYLKAVFVLLQEASRTRDIPLTQLPGMSEAQVKALRIEIKKKINTALNQLASTTSQVIRTCETLREFQRRLKAGPNDALNFFRFQLCDRLLQLADKGGQVSTRPSAAWAYAFLVRGLVQEDPPLERWLKAHVYAACCYAAPFYYRKKQGQSLEQFKTVRGQRESEDEEAFFARMAACLRLWLAYLVAAHKEDEVWSWFARFINLNLAGPKAARRVCACALVVGLKVAGAAALKVYGRQFQKVIDVVQTHLKPLLVAMQQKSGASYLSMYATQLETLLSDYYANNRTLPEPEGKAMKMEATEANPDV